MSYTPRMTWRCKSWANFNFCVNYAFKSLFTPTMITIRMTITIILASAPTEDLFNIYFWRLLLYSQVDSDRPSVIPIIFVLIYLDSGMDFHILKYNVLWQNDWTHQIFSFQRLSLVFQGQNCWILSFILISFSIYTPGNHLYCVLVKDCSYKEWFLQSQCHCFLLFSFLLSFGPVAPQHLNILCNVSSAVGGETLGLLSLGRLWLPSSRALFEFLGRLLDLQHVGLKASWKTALCYFSQFCLMTGSRC